MSGAEDNWDQLLTVLGDVLSHINRDDAMSLVKVIDEFPDEARREFELDILETIHNAASETLK